MTQTAEAEVPPVTSPEQAAQVLGVAATADPQVIHQAYRTASRAVHPDVGGSANQFRQVSSAYELLLWQQQQRPSGVGQRLRRGPVVWAPSGVRTGQMLVAVAHAGGLVAVAVAFGSPMVTALAISAGIALLMQALYGATGRAPASPEYWRRQAEQRRQRREFANGETSEIPVMTDERIRQYEQTGR